MGSDGEAKLTDTPSITNKSIIWAFGLTFILFISQLIGGYLSNSLAIISDAWHLLSDLLALSVSWFALAQAKRPANHRMTYGYHRFGIFAALFNNLTLIGISVFIYIFAIGRIISPQPVHAPAMMMLALVGFVVTFIIVVLLKRGEQNLNTKSALLHFFGDVLSYAGVVLGGIIIYYTGWLWVDPLLSIVFATIITVNAWKMLKESVLILLQAVPAELDVRLVERKLLALSGVKAVRDLHIWSLTSEKVMLSAHITTSFDKLEDTEDLLVIIQHQMADLGIRHCTIQFETSVCGSCPKQWRKVESLPTREISQLCIHNCPTF